MSGPVVTTLLTVAAIIAVFLTLFIVVTRPASGGDLNPATMKALIMSIQSAADAMSQAAGAISTAATSLTDAAGKLQGANDTTVLDAPIAALNDAVTSLNSAAAAITALVPAQ